FALGSALWGAVASLTSLPAALLAATVAMLAGLLLAKRFPLRMGADLEVTPAPLEHLLIANEPDPEAGPVAVELIYRVRPEAVEAFTAAVALLKAPRQRDGALFWRLYRDLGDGERYVERFIVQSWADYLHQRSRRTIADRELEAALRAHLAEGSAIEMRHYLAER
ncbi:MFS transporter, partial [Arenimonas sp.]|uniref:MFS transporter n=1 Tax=Arenimonas sp. TaxID=1872635 RepID=UPI002E32BA82